MDSSRFNLNLLRTFDVLLDERNVSRAAERLGLSQPAVSAALAQLRAALDDPLLVRRGNELLPSALALAIAPRVKHILAEVRGVLQGDPDFDPGRDVRRFRVAAIDLDAGALIVPFALRLRSQYPRIAVDVVSIDGDVKQQLAAGTWDVAVGPDFLLGDGAQREELFSDAPVIVARAGHPRLKARPTLNAFFAEQQVRISPRPTDILDVALKTSGRERIIGLTVSSFWQALQVVSQTDMIATLPARLATETTRGTTLQLLRHPVRMRQYRVMVAWHQRSTGDQGVRWIMNELRQFVLSIGS